MADKADKTTKEPKASKVDPNETKAQKFHRLGKPRMIAAIKAISLVGNLAGSGYEYTTQETLSMEAALQKAVKDTMQKFAARGDKEKPTFDF